jgi:hypothetical protein
MAIQTPIQMSASRRLKTIFRWPLRPLRTGVLGLVLLTSLGFNVGVGETHAFAQSSSSPQGVGAFSPQGVGAPQVAVTPDGSQQLVFWKGTNNQLNEAWYTNQWNGPVGFGQLGTLTSTPGVAVTKDGSQQLVFWEGPSGHLFEAWYTLSAWHGPLDITNAYLGGHAILASAPSVVTTTDGSQLVFWKGTDGHLGEAWYAAGGWHGPADFTTTGTLASAPSATVSADGSQQLVFWQGTDNHLTQVWYALGSWHGPQDWSNLGSISSQPSVTVTPDGTQQLVFYKTAAGHLMESWYTNQWNGPVDYTASAFAGQGLLSSSPSATVTVDGSQQLVFWQGAGNSLWEAWYTNQWNGPRNWTPPPPFTFGDGTWRVGSQVPAGTYRTRQAASGCYWERLSGFGGTLGEIIANHFGDGYQVVTIASTDAGFHTASCGAWTSDLSATGAWPTQNGIFIVGTDLSPGTYSAPGGSSCYWARLSGFGGTPDQIIANGLGQSAVIVTIAPTDTGFETQDCGSWSGP